ncbi:hypothetical protein HDU96_001497 [Phlyctochytrium bullatum]|nr:hypothetical protein HDU96_001497 [Phlyctochytrium bullatum]
MAMTVPASIKDISDNPATVAVLESVYGVDGRDQVDLLVGCLAESPRPSGFAFGETAFTNSSMLDVLKRNFPEVVVHAASVDNVFKPWKFNGAPVEREYQIRRDA